VHILLVDPSDQTRTLLETNLADGGTNGHSITLLRPKTRKQELAAAGRDADVVLFGVRVTEKTVVRLTAALRAARSTVPILVLTEESEGGISRQFKKAGVDDMLNVAELSTPLIAWTFMSTLKQAEVKKKAGDFDALREQLADITNTLAFITHEINNPLSVIRLALYHLENLEITPEKRQNLFRIISESLDKVQSQTEELRLVRRQLGNGAQPPEMHAPRLKTGS